MIPTESLIEKQKITHAELWSKFENIMNALNQSSIVAITDHTGEIIYVNDKFCDISGYSRPELIGKNHRVLMSGKHSADFFADLWSTISAGNVWQGEIKNKAKDGSYYWVDTTIVPFMKKGKPVEYIAIRKEITDKKNMDEALEKERAKAIYVEKMASLGELSAGIAHEIGNPLGAVRGRIEMLEMLAKKGDATQEKVVEFCKKSLKIIDRTSRIISGLRSYARDASMDPYNKVSLTKLLKDILEFSKVRTNKNGIELLTEGLEVDHIAECRESEIGQVLVNLINNACDAIKNLDSCWIKLVIKDINGDVVITVTDSGSGIPKNNQQKIFEPFYTTKDVGAGTGLGLSISNTIVMNHGGKMYIDNECKYTRFVFTLPRKQKH